MSDKAINKCAANVLDTMHLMMRSIGAELKNRAPSDLSMQQFRALLRIRLNRGTSLSDVADNLGATISSTSKLIDSLFERGLVKRETDSNDRRKLVLTITDDGIKAMDGVDLAALTFLSGRISSFTESECAMVNLGMDLIRSAFTNVQENES